MAITDNLALLDPTGLAAQVAEKNSEGYKNAEKNALLSVNGLEGLSGFLFDVPESERVELSADITDHYVESGSFIQDHKVIKPVTITLSGFIGEIFYRGGSGFSGLLGNLSHGLTAVSAFTGGQTIQAAQVAQRAIDQVQAAAAQVENVVSSVSGVVQALSKIEAPTKQQVAYQKLKLLFESEVLLTLQTPWNYYENLMIRSLSFSQSEESATTSLIKVTLKEIRLANVDVLYEVFQEGLLNRNVLQKASGGAGSSVDKGPFKSGLAHLTDGTKTLLQVLPGGTP